MADTDRARTLRREATKAERLLRHELKVQSHDFRFRFQHPIGPYFVDFYCSEVKLVIEVDGQSHDDTHERDVAREEFLRKEGFDLMRYSNWEVLQDPASVAGAVIRAAKELHERRFLRMRSAADPSRRLE